MTSPQDTQIDGRHARRVRGRMASIDAMIDLVLEGHMPPTPEQVSARAGVSVATLYRYFDTLPTLYGESGLRFLDRFGHKAHVPDFGEGPIDKRIAALVNSRIELFELTGPMQRFANQLTSSIPSVAEFLQDQLNVFHDQLSVHFAEELSSLTPAIRADRIAVLVALTSFDSYEQMTNTFGLTTRQLKRAWTSALHALLA